MPRDIRSQCSIYLLLAAGYLLLALVGIQLTREAGGIASIWPPNALMIAFLLIGHATLIPAFVGCAIANFLANWIMGSSGWEAAGFATVNMTEVAVTVGLVRYLRPLPVDRLDIWAFVHIIAGILAGVIVAAMLGAWLIHALYMAPFVQVFLTWFAADFSSNILIGFAIVAWMVQRTEPGPVRRLPENFAVAALFAVTAWLVFVDNARIGMDSFIPALLWVAARYGLRWIGLAIIALLIAATGLTLAGFWHPPATEYEPFAAQILLVQEFVLLSAIGMIPLALVIETNRETTQRLVESEDRYRTIYNNTPVMLHSINDQGQLISVSDYWLKNLGYRRDEVIGRRSIEFLTAESQELAKLEFKKFAKTGLCQNVPYQMVRKDGSLIDVLLSGTSERSATGIVVGTSAVIVDVTERNRAQQQLRDAIASLDTGFILYDKDLKIVIYNDLCKRLLDRCADVIGIGVSLQTMLQATSDRKQFEIHQRDEDWVKKTANEHKVGVNCNLYKSHDGRWIEIRKQVTGEGGLVTTIADISAIKFAEDKIAERNLALERANADLNSFVNIASHDLKAPLRAVAFLSDCVLETWGADREVKYGVENQRNLELIQSRISRMDRMLDDLLTYARIGRQANAAEPVDTKFVIRDMAALHQPSMLTITIAPDMPWIVSQRSLFETVCRNLISNVIKHHDRPTGKLDVSANAAGGRVMIRFTDDGPGIKEHHKSRVFDLFATLKSRDELEATGLGLSIVKRIVEMEDGRIWIEDNPTGRGSVFVIDLPQAQSNNPAIDNPTINDAESELHDGQVPVSAAGDPGSKGVQDAAHAPPLCV